MIIREPSPLDSLSNRFCLFEISDADSLARVNDVVFICDENSALETESLL